MEDDPQIQCLGSLNTYSPEAMLRLRVNHGNTGQKNGVHAFGYNTAKSELIWMKSGTM